MTDGNQNLPNELFTNRQTFLRFNHHRIRKILNTLAPEDRQAFTIIPRLLHVNQKGLPGYINDEVPSGIQNFVLNHESRFTAESLFPDTIIRANHQERPFIESVLLMGSMGSVAQSRKSDLDFTVFINKDMITTQQRALFNQKLSLIEEWTWKTYNLEIHFFSNDVSEVRNNIFGESDTESTGSAQAKLLKEEMLRTAVIMAGKIPFWWIVPLETDDSQYDHLLHLVRSHQTLLTPQDFLDIGNVDDISRGEFFGGSIWTLIKSFKAPFKTLIKMGLMEEYMFRVTKSKLLCHEIKKKVFEGIPFDQIDPYIILFERAESFFKDTKTPNDIDALRTAFYLKVGSRLSAEEIKAGSTDSRKRLLLDLIQSWKWPIAKVEHLNDYLNWQMMEKVALGNRVNKILMTSYKNISEANKRLSSEQSLITERDTHLLGRKLFSFYRKTPNKVENLFALVDGETSEKELTFLYHRLHPRDKGAWYLIRGKTLDFIEQIPEEKIIKKATTLQFLISFTCFNGLYSPNTFLLMRSEQQSIKDMDLRNLLEDLSGFLSQVNIADISNEDLMANAHVRQLYMIVDFGNPIPREITIGSIKECKNMEDYSHFIHKRLERIRSVVAIFLTSWGELYCKTYSGLMCLSRCLSDMQPRILELEPQSSEFLKIFIPGSRKETDPVPWLKSYIIRSLQVRSLETNKLLSLD